MLFVSHPDPSPLPFQRIYPERSRKAMNKTNPFISSEGFHSREKSRSSPVSKNGNRLLSKKSKREMLIILLSVTKNDFWVKGG